MSKLGSLEVYVCENWQLQMSLKCCPYISCASYPWRGTRVRNVRFPWGSGATITKPTPSMTSFSRLRSRASGCRPLIVQLLGTKIAHYMHLLRVSRYLYGLRATTKGKILLPLPIDGMAGRPICMTSQCYTVVPACLRGHCRCRS